MLLMFFGRMLEKEEWAHAIACSRGGTGAGGRDLTFVSRGIVSMLKIRRRTPLAIQMIDRRWPRLGAIANAFSRTSFPVYGLFKTVAHHAELWLRSSALRLRPRHDLGHVLKKTPSGCCTPMSTGFGVIGVPVCMMCTRRYPGNSESCTGYL